MIRWPEKLVCPIHGYESPRPEEGGCRCFECKMVNEAIDLCIKAELEGRVSVEELEKVLMVSNDFHILVAEDKTEGIVTDKGFSYKSYKLPMIKGIAQAIFTRLYGDGEGENGK